MNEILQNCPVFKGLNSESLKSLLSKNLHQLKSYKKDDLIISEGEILNDLCVVIRGSVRGEMIDFKGKTIKIEDINSPRPIALAFLFGNKNSMPVSVIANINTEILFIPKESFLRMMQQNEIILKNVLNNISSRANFLSNKIKFLSFKTIKSKLAAYLISQSKIKGKDFICSKTQKQLAEFFGVTRPSVARSFAELEKEGVIILKNKNVKILDSEALKKLI